ncbi:MAG: o-succinylbenzoate synthase [bacterium]
MKITNSRLLKYRLNCLRPLPAGKERLSERIGLIVVLTDENGKSGLGEAAPLPGFSSETITTVQAQLSALCQSLKGTEIPPDIERLSDGFERWLHEYDPAPSARFAIETAVLNLVAAGRGLPLRRLFSDNALDSVSICGLLAGSRSDILKKAALLKDEGYRAMKLKVGHRSLEEDIKLTHDVRKAIGDDVAFRLDANRAWSVEEVLVFAREVRDCRIAYIEEPVYRHELTNSIINKTNLFVGLDESLRELTPESLKDMTWVRAIVLKPTLLGLWRCMQFARVAVSMGIVSVVSSSFESGVGLMALAELAACLNSDDTPAGLDTLDRFEHDLLVNPLDITGGRLLLPGRVLHPDDLRHDLLQEIRCA